MAKNKSAQYPHQWPDGTWHSITWQQHQQNLGQSQGGSVYINGQQVTPQQWQSGALASAMTTPGVAPGAAGPAPGGTPQPFSAAAAQAQQQAGWNIGIGNAEAGFQANEAAWGLGYNADGSLNTANPYSQAQLLQDNYKRSLTGTTNSMAAQGQLYSGAKLNALARDDRLYAEGSSALKDQARLTHHGIKYGQLTNYGQNAIGGSQAGLDALMGDIYK